MSEIIQVPLQLLSITSTNARRDHVADKSMVASLKAQGLLYPLLVRGIDGSESYDVVDGARRLTCILKGLEDGDLDVAHFGSLPCILSNGDATSSGLEQSLHANLHMAMHPLDECEAILKIAEDETDKAVIALRFGQDERWLDQRVKLASLCDEVKETFRKGEISLAAAMKFTLGSHELQRAFLKKHAKDGFATSMIEPAMTEAKVSYKNCNFDLDQYTGPQERDLFGDDIWLTDRKLVAELQDKWAAEEVAELEKQGYDTVKILARDDWQTLNNTVEVTGRIAAADRAKLSCFLKADHHGYITVNKNRIARGKVDDKGKIKKKTHSADETDVANVKPQLCTELTVAQQEIVNAYAASDLYAQVIEGDELLEKYLVISNQFGNGWTEGAVAHRYNGTIDRWERLNKAYPNEKLIVGEEIGPWDQDDRKQMSFKDFMTIPKKQRDDLYRQAVASMIHVPFGQQVLGKDLPELAKYDWLKPGEDFFKRYSTAQLIDYRKRSGDKEAGKTAKKKGDHVKDCVVAADSPHAFKLGRYANLPVRKNRK